MPGDIWRTTADLDDRWQWQRIGDGYLIEDSQRRGVETTYDPAVAERIVNDHNELREWKTLAQKLLEYRERRRASD
jgi:hypothetical protein